MLINYFVFLIYGLSFLISQQWDLPSKYLSSLYYHHSSNYIWNSDLLVFIILFCKNWLFCVTGILFMGKTLHWRLEETQRGQEGWSDVWNTFHKRSKSVSKEPAVWKGDGWGNMLEICTIASGTKRVDRGQLFAV